MSLPPRGEGDGAPDMATGPPPNLNVMPHNNDELIQAIMQMGISRDEAQLAVQQTGGNSVEAAISWFFENGDSVREDAQLMEQGIYQEYKMVFVVNGSLLMGVGKTAAQVGHAAVDLYRRLIVEGDDYGGAVLQWSENGSKKIALRGENAEELIQLARKAETLGLPNTIIQDAGRTEVPSGSRTVLAIFGPSNKIDEVTGRLKLLQ